MEIELFQDALEDAHYVHALNAGHLEPSRPLPEIDKEATQRYVEQLREKNPQALELEQICREPLGFYLVSYIFTNPPLPICYYPIHIS
jgi:hypothetical protein